MRLEELDTPCLLLDRARLERNCAAMTARMREHGVRLRPHLKTAKSIDVARIALEGNFGGITVATLNEAEYFAAEGLSDILLSTCIVPDKLGRVEALVQHGAALTVVTDDPTVARELAARVRFPLDVLIEIDCGEHRTGITPEAPELIPIAQALDPPKGLRLRGVLTHAGHAYRFQDPDTIRAIAEDERERAVAAAERLRGAGFEAPVVSVGSTPTAAYVEDATGVTEMRPGVYVFGDLFQAAIGSCNRSDVAVSVLATVISVDREDRRVVLDAGALALSKDRSTQTTARDAGYGEVVALDGTSLGGLIVSEVHQEHGEVRTAREELRVGSRVRVLPNHACLTAAAHDRYHVLDEEGRVVASWPRTNGW